MILLKKLQLNNFLSHEKTEINFEAHEKALIDGASGAGKSSIFDSILWVLYGQGRADNRSLVRKGAKKGSVCLELTRGWDDRLETETVIITRSATPAGKHTLEVAIEQPDGSRAAYPLSGVRELQAWIDKDLIGASYLLFINSVAYVQGGTESFVAQTAPKRKELLLEIVKAEDYDKYYENARKTLSGIENDTQRASGQLQEMETRLTGLRGRIEDPAKHIQVITDNSIKLKDIEVVIKDLEAKKASFTAIEQTVSILDGVLSDSIAIQQTASFALDTSKAKVATRDRYETLAGAVPSYVTSIEETTIKLAGLRGTLATASESEAKRNAHYAKKPVVRNRERELGDYAARIEKILLEPVCPSGTDCPYSGDHTKQVEDLRANIKAVVAEMEKETTALNEWTAEEATLPPATDLRITMKEIGETEAHLKNLESEYAKAKEAGKELAIIDELAKQIPDLQKTFDEKTAKVEDAKKRKEEAAASIDKQAQLNTSYQLHDEKKKKEDLVQENSRATYALETIDRDKKEIIEVENRIKTINESDLTHLREKARKVAMVKEAFGSKGIETMVIDYLLPKLEDKINEVLSQLSDFRVRLDTQRKSADGESIIEGLFITILNEINEEMPFEAYSGGEKLKISVAISEALASMQRVGFRLFDETFIGLDENSTESFAEVLEGLQKNFRQVLVISHLLQIKELFDKKVVISKNNGISYVKS